jgi:hypothetical protein
MAKRVSSWDENTTIARRWFRSGANAFLLDKDALGSYIERSLGFVRNSALVHLIRDAHEWPDQAMTKSAGGVKKGSR